MTCFQLRQAQHIPIETLLGFEILAHYTDPYWPTKLQAIR